MTTKEEAKRFQEAVAKVREVVRTAPKEEVALALLNYEMDINRTIQAFYEDGAKSALDTWERTGHKKKKKQVTKKKAELHSASMQTKPDAVRVSSTSAASTPVSFISNTTPLASSEIASTISQPFSPSRSSKKLQRVSNNIPFTTNGIVPIKDAKNKKQTFDNSSASNAKVPNHEFDCYNHLSSINLKVFKEVRQLIDERERHLLAELSRIHDDDAHLLKERQHTANNLVRRIERLNAMSDREQQDLLDEIKRYLQSSCFIGKQFSERQRFNCDKKAISKIIKNFGEIVTFKSSTSNIPNTISDSFPTASATSPIMENATSHSSLNSSYGEDSGIYQTSPASKGKEISKDTDNGKTVVNVSTGVLSMSSDGLSAEQLVQMTKDVQESLMAQVLISLGIDPSILSSITGKTAMPFRRRPPGGQRGGRPAGRGNIPVKVPELSILQS
ncbi:unnamed protein product [Dracunculus medinensis]|uniref:Uncharacterized protein n=1 Tax=Dracunculus medinensis TaxID=318479 RepID=A0A0N4UB17_DRAME|nr:unnamed protein product [Dracunculus medinensis]